MKQTEIKITYNLSSVDLVNRTGVLKIRQEHLSKGKTIEVTLSAQLIGKIKFNMKSPKHNKAIKLVNVDYTSALKSPRYLENPFKLIKFTHGDKPDTFHLQMVDDKGSFIKEYSNAMNKRVEERVFKHWKPYQYIRFWTVDLAK